MNNSLSVNILRILLVIFDVVIFVAGAIMTGFGIYLVIEAQKYSTAGSVNAIASAFLVLGLLVLITGFFGCCGAMKMNKCFLLLVNSFFFVVLMVIGEIACTTALIVNKDKLRPYIRKYFLSAIQEIESNNNTELLRTILYLQDEMDCCGANGPADWKAPNRFCCEDGRQLCFTYPLVGCVNEIYRELRENIVGIGATIFALAVLEVGAIMTAVVLANKNEPV
ncbi:tetraspanin [Echinococcus multilocularis]|uniref:Tetraspanin n=1 Tax=Echinococcus multilocularis TaxID=6211 RepID=A0A068YJS4_ECHMU|nr:tetraspanin [Echinococcus multilocularis]